ncbi:hypothetical protein BO85DRAFT_137273 [Aspergillus piperis CBS 112811]|uniref:Uncharacterized protein n=1 Tax=Aspergillus piperis CBS 112811 TaxID=1448313 RepID=A0A8G1RCE9_9EURO|nr:hypothetical protein BO85DRAFT_137273 [Aspergillus piperis CBS 112811]RAH62487.1 hypothetical protein BO85DRAFT_137273 [Aspergillus piperis CBS 112811]
MLMQKQEKQQIRLLFYLGDFWLILAEKILSRANGRTRKTEKVGRRGCSVGKVWAMPAAMRTLHDLARCCDWTGPVQRLSVGLLSDNKHYKARRDSIRSDQGQQKQSLKSYSVTAPCPPPNQKTTRQGRRSNRRFIHLRLNLLKLVTLQVVAIFA